MRVLFAYSKVIFAWKRRNCKWIVYLGGLCNRQEMPCKIVYTENVDYSNANLLQTKSQNCIVHQFRNSSKYASYKNLKAPRAALKSACVAEDESAASAALDAFAER